MYHTLSSLYQTGLGMKLFVINVYTLLFGMSFITLLCTICTYVGMRGIAKRSSKRGIDINLKDLVKTLMFHGHVEGLQCVSDDLALFQHLITAFYQYEQMVSLGQNLELHVHATFSWQTQHVLS